MSNSFYHKDLTETQWSRIKFVFEEPRKVGRPSLNPRIVFNAILWILKSGGRWRDLPAHYGIGTAFTTSSDNGAKRDYLKN